MKYAGLIGLSLGKSRSWAEPVGAKVLLVPGGGFEAGRAGGTCQQQKPKASKRSLLLQKGFRSSQ